MNNSNNDYSRREFLRQFGVGILTLATGSAMAAMESLEDGVAPASSIQDRENSIITRLRSAPNAKDPQINIDGKWSDSYSIQLGQIGERFTVKVTDDNYTMIQYNEGQVSFLRGIKDLKVAGKHLTFVNKKQNYTSETPDILSDMVRLSREPSYNSSYVRMAEKEDPGTLEKLVDSADNGLPKPAQ